VSALPSVFGRVFFFDVDSFYAPLKVSCRLDFFPPSYPWLFILQFPRFLDGFLAHFSIIDLLRFFLRCWFFFLSLPYTCKPSLPVSFPAFFITKWPYPINSFTIFFSCSIYFVTCFFFLVVYSPSFHIDPFSVECAESCFLGLSLHPLVFPFFFLECEILPDLPCRDSALIPVFLLFLFPPIPYNTLILRASFPPPPPPSLFLLVYHCALPAFSGGGLPPPRSSLIPSDITR